MRSIDVARTALGNTMRSKMRTFLTVIAIVIGAFTLALTTGLGAGINKYVDNVVAGFGDSNQIMVMAGGEDGMVEASVGPQEYDPDAAQGDEMFGGAPMLDDDDIEMLEDIDGVTEVDPIFFVSAQYLEVAEGTQYQLDSLGFPSDANNMTLAAGELPQRDAMEITIPQTWLPIYDEDASDWEEIDPEIAVGETIELGIYDMVFEENTVEATIVGVSEEDLAGVGGQIMPSHALNDDLYEIQTSGLDTNQPDAYIQAVMEVSNLEQDEERIKSELQDEGMMGMTVEDMLGMVQGVIDAVTWVLSGFALIALLAASFGIVNTLLMSVQERTREIGLMKALGMSRGRVFGLFSMEAVMIGVMGSVIGVGLGVITGVVGNQILVNGPLSNVAGLSLYAVDPVSLGLIFALILLIAFLAGTMPAARAAKKDPIEALRYE